MSPIVRAMVVFGFLIGIGKSSVAQSSPSAKMQQVIQTHVANHTFMGSVLVVKNGKTILNQGYGYADLEWGIPNSPETKFRIASLTKQFTAAAILLLEERGKLKLNDPVAKYVPDAPANWSGITIFHLLTHTSGIMDIKQLPPDVFAQWKPATPAELVARFSNKLLDFAPGTQARYSNSGYILLGYIIEKVSGESYAEFLKQNIFQPLGMNDTGVDDNARILQKRAQGYQQSDNGLKHADYIDMSIPLAAGDIYSTSGDLQKWEQGLFHGKLLSQESFKKMTTAYKDEYGFGVMVTQPDGHKLIAHTGGIQGFACELRFYPEDELLVVVLGNIGIDASTREITEAISGIALQQ